MDYIIFFKFCLGKIAKLKNKLIILCSPLDNSLDRKRSFMSQVFSAVLAEKWRNLDDIVAERRTNKA